MTEALLELYQRLWEVFGPLGWWPGETPFEVALGAILTQNTNWNNVARVIAALKERGLLGPGALRELPEAQLGQMLRPVGYYNVKARRVKNFLRFLQEEAQDDLEKLALGELEDLRPRLLAVKGIGPETADSILLYALEKPTFVVDAYTFRVLFRHHLVEEACSYEELRHFFMSRLPSSVPLFKEYHALLVKVGKEFCRPRPRCPECLLADWRHPTF